ncbi:potassium ABC transporter ATPase [Duganella guangzhouensis]|nr:potassium ABC transporter ATPase [Duganella guangzhouensis]
MDFIFIGATALFFLLTVAMAAGCDKLGGRP